MNKKQFVLLAIILAIFSYLGGTVSFRLLSSKISESKSESKKETGLFSAEVIHTTELFVKRLWIEEDNFQMRIGIDLNGEPMFSIYDKKGITRFDLRLIENDSLNLIIFNMNDKKGNFRLGASVMGDGFSSIRFLDKDFNPRSYWMTNEDGAPRFIIADENGKSRLALGRTELQQIKTGSIEIRPPSSIVLFDKDGKIIWKTP